MVVIISGGLLVFLFADDGQLWLLGELVFQSTGGVYAFPGCQLHTRVDIICFLLMLHIPSLRLASGLGTRT